MTTLVKYFTGSNSKSQPQCVSALEAWYGKFEYEEQAEYNNANFKNAQYIEPLTSQKSIVLLQENSATLQALDLQTMDTWFNNFVHIEMQFSAPVSALEIKKFMQQVPDDIFSRLVEHRTTYAQQLAHYFKSQHLQMSKEHMLQEIYRTIHLQEALNVCQIILQ